MDRARLLEKIQKCLALSSSPEPHEAASALRQAQKLIDLHGVTDAELGLASYASEKVDCPVQASRAMPEFLGRICNLIGRAFGVRVTVHSEVRVSDRSWCITYFGKQDRVALAAYTHPVIHRAMDGSWRKFLKANPQVKGRKGARTSFYVGWLYAVEAKVDAFAMGPEEKEELHKYIESCDPGVSERKAQQPRDTQYDKGLVRAGHRAAKDFSLHTPLGG